MNALGRVYFWQGGSLWIGRGSGRTEWHGHHAHQITLPFSAACLFRNEQDEEWKEYAGAFVRSERPHQFEMADAAAAQIFVEPETIEGRALALRFAGADIAPLPESDRAAMARMLMTAWDAAVDDGVMIATARAAVATLARRTVAAAAVDGRIAKALELIRTRISGPIRLADAAEAAALSPNRFRHLFVQETGAAFRAYVLWSRLNVAIACSMAGGSWTAAAHEAGFADSAHLTRTFKRMFGMNPATLVRG
ncbi:MAG: AraC family transcriptional regulator [Burkholderiales bacterium]|nr:AraC family transcriptional regulator [Burkholderiales bacterium]